MALSGNTASAWLAARGFTVKDPASPAKIAADVIRSRHFSLSRIWHKSTNLVRESDDFSGLIATFVLEGQGSIRIESTSLNLSKGDGVITDAQSTLEIESKSPLAILDVRHGGRFSERFALPVLTEPRRVAATATPVRTLLVLANTALSNSYPEDPTWHLQEVAVENLMAAVIIDANEDQRAPEKDELFRRAKQIIIARSSRIGFGITELANEMGIPIRTLQEVFAKNDNTARQLIKQTRVINARQEMERRGPEKFGDMVAIAHLSGFPNVRALRAALNEFPEEIMSRADSVERSDELDGRRALLRTAKGRSENIAR